MKKRILIGLLLMAMLFALVVPAYAAAPVTQEIGKYGNMLAVLEPTGEKSMMQWVKSWHDNGAPEYIGYVIRSNLYGYSMMNSSDVYAEALYESINGGLFKNISEQWKENGADLRKEEVTEVPELWIVAMKEDTEENRAALAALPSNPCVFLFIRAEISFNELSAIYTEIVDYARYRLAVYDVDFGDALYFADVDHDKVYVLVSFLHYGSIKEKLTELYGDHVKVISNGAAREQGYRPFDQYRNYQGMRHESYSYELYLLASAALLALTLLVWGIVSLIIGLIKLIRRRNNHDEAAPIPKKRRKAWKVFLIIIAAELVVILGAGAVMTVIHSKGFSEKPTLNTDTRVVKLGKYKGIDYKPKGDAEADERAILLRATGYSEFYLNRCDISYTYDAIYQRITADAKARGMEIDDTYFDTVLKPKLGVSGNYYDGMNDYLSKVSLGEEMKIRLLAEAIAKKEHITVTEEDIAAAGAKLGYAAGDLTEGSAALEEATAKALQTKVGAFLVGNA